MLTAAEIAAIPLSAELSPEPWCRGRSRSAVGEGSMAIAFVHQYLREIAERASRSA